MKYDVKRDGYRLNWGGKIGYAALGFIFGPIGVLLDKACMPYWPERLMILTIPPMETFGWRHRTETAEPRDWPMDL